MVCVCVVSGVHVATPPLVPSAWFGVAEANTRRSGIGPAADVERKRKGRMEDVFVDPKEIEEEEEEEGRRPFLQTRPSARASSWPRACFTPIRPENQKKKKNWQTKEIFSLARPRNKRKSLLTKTQEKWKKQTRKKVNYYLPPHSFFFSSYPDQIKSSRQISVSFLLLPSLQSKFFFFFLSSWRRRGKKETMIRA